MTAVDDVIVGFGFARGWVAILGIAIKGIGSAIAPAEVPALAALAVPVLLAEPIPAAAKLAPFGTTTEGRAIAPAIEPRRPIAPFTTITPFTTIAPGRAIVTIPTLIPVPLRPVRTIGSIAKGPTELALTLAKFLAPEV